MHCLHRVIMWTRRPRSIYFVLFISSLLATAERARCDDGDEPIFVTLDPSGVRFPDKDSVDLLCTTGTDYFDSKTRKSISTSDGYRIRLKFDERWRLIGRQIDAVWSGNDGRFGHPVFAAEQRGTFIHVRDDGGISRFISKGLGTFEKYSFDETTRQWGEPAIVKFALREGSFNISVEGARWRCVEQGKPPNSVVVYDLYQDREVKDKWLETTILNNFIEASTRNSTRVSNEKNLVAFKNGKDDYEEVLLFGFGTTGSTTYLAPLRTRLRAVCEGRIGRAALIFSLAPNSVFAHEIDRQSMNRIINFKDISRTSSQSLYNSANRIWYYPENRTIVGVDVGIGHIRPLETAFQAKVVLSQWNLETDRISESVFSFADHFSLVNRHVVPKLP